MSEISSGLVAVRIDTDGYPLVRLSDAEAIIAQKDAERFREGWTHACNALCMEIALWIERCPHCGMPAPKAPAMQEDKA